MFALLRRVGETSRYEIPPQPAALARPLRCRDSSPQRGAPQPLGSAILAAADEFEFWRPKAPF
jgi:hypothetical protein